MAKVGEYFGKGHTVQILLCGSYSLFANYSTLKLQHDSSHGQRLKEWVAASIMLYVPEQTMWAIYNHISCYTVSQNFFSLFD